MKNLAQVCIGIAIVTFVLALLEKMGVKFLVMFSPLGYVKATQVFLLLGINFELLELLKK